MCKLPKQHASGSTSGINKSTYTRKKNFRHPEFQSTNAVSFPHMREAAAIIFRQTSQRPESMSPKECLTMQPNEFQQRIIGREHFDLELTRHQEQRVVGSSPQTRNCALASTDPIRSEQRSLRTPIAISNWGEGGVDGNGIRCARAFCRRFRRIRVVVMPKPWRRLATWRRAGDPIQWAVGLLLLLGRLKAQCLAHQAHASSGGRRRAEAAEGWVGG